jgi:hypothetical protein
MFWFLSRNFRTAIIGLPMPNEAQYITLHGDHVATNTGIVAISAVFDSLMHLFEYIVVVELMYLMTTVVYLHE